MRYGTLLLLLCAAAAKGQAAAYDIAPSQLQAVIGQPLDQAVKQREVYKGPLRTAYAHQITTEGKDCQAEVSGQQPYNICMGRVSEAVDRDFAVFYNSLQMLCHDQEQLKTLQDSEVAWRGYRDSAMAAAHAAWPDGTGAPGFAGAVYMSIVRDRMRELSAMYALNIAQ